MQHAYFVFHAHVHHPGDKASTRATRSARATASVKADRHSAGCQALYSGSFQMIARRRYSASSNFVDNELDSHAHLRLTTVVSIINTRAVGDTCRGKTAALAVELPSNSVHDERETIIPCAPSTCCCRHLTSKSRRERTLLLARLLSLPAMASGMCLGPGGSIASTKPSTDRPPGEALKIFRRADSSATGSRISVDATAFSIIVVDRRSQSLQPFRTPCLAMEIGNWRFRP